MKKIILLLFIFLLSGCSVQYNLDIDKTLTLSENVTVNASTEDEYEIIKNYGYLPLDINMDDPSVFEQKVDDVEYYDITKTKDKIKFSYTYDQDKYINSLFARGAYEFISVSEPEGELVLSTSKEFLLFDTYDNLDEVKVTINSKYKLIKSNADIEERHSYTWIINKENAYGKNIYLRLDTTKEDLTFLEKLKNGDYTSTFTISIIVFLVGIIIYFIIKKIGDKRNKI